MFQTFLRNHLLQMFSCGGEGHTDVSNRLSMFWLKVYHESKGNLVEMTQPNETKKWKEAAGYSVGRSMNCTASLEGNWTISLKSVTVQTFQASKATSKNFFYV